MFNDARPSTKIDLEDETAVADDSIVDFTENSGILENLLLYLYPVVRPVRSTIAGRPGHRRRGIQVHHRPCRPGGAYAIQPLAEEQPLRAYAMAIDRRNEAAARGAARECPSRPMPDLDEICVQEQLQDATVGGYFRLRSYHAACGVAVAAVIKRRSTDTTLTGQPWFANTHDVCESMHPSVVKRWWPRQWWMS